MERPNILLIMTDQMRGDCLGIAGHPDVKTPYLDHLAARGTRFPNAYCAVPSCIPARCSLFTGLTQEHHRRVGYQDRIAWDYDCTLAGELAKGGYYTQCVGKMHVHPLRSLMGFHNIDLHDGYLDSYRKRGLPYEENQRVADDYFYWLKSELGIDRDVTDTGVEVNSFVARPWPYAERYHPTNWVTDRSIDFLRRRDRSKPFFLMSSYVRPHPPFDAPACFFDLYDRRELTAPVVGAWADAQRLARRGRLYDSDTGPIDPELMRRAQVGYYACISHLDNQIGRLITALIEERIFENTVILFCSDHGELLGDHHTYRKVRPYQGSIRIPMIVCNAPRLHDQQGAVSDMLVELRDVMPTLLDLAGLPIPESLDGLTMARENHREYLHGEHSWPELGNQFVVTKTDKFCWFNATGQEQYFDLEHDPQERVDRIDDPACQDRIGQLRRALVRTLQGREEGYTDGQRLLAERPQTTMLSAPFDPPQDPLHL